MSAVVQIFGIKKCSDTRKAERFFKERRIPYQFVDLTIKGLSRGELEKVSAVTGGISSLMNKDGKEYEARNLKYIIHDEKEELLAHPLLLRTPIVRMGAKATVGYVPEEWKTWQ